MTAWLRGLSAFPLTPLRDGGVDEAALENIVDMLPDAAVDSIGVLGSTGAYTYLTREQRRRVVEIAARRSGDLPVMAGIGHCATDEVLALAADAQRAGADAVLPAPVTYQALTDDEVVVGLYGGVARELSVPLVVYDNPSTTHVDLSLETYARITAFPQVAAVKIPPVTAEPARAHRRREGGRSGAGADWHLRGRRRRDGPSRRSRPVVLRPRRHSAGTPARDHPGSARLSRRRGTAALLPTRRAVGPVRRVRRQPPRCRRGRTIARPRVRARTAPAPAPAGSCPAGTRPAGAGRARAVSRGQWFIRARLRPRRGAARTPGERPRTLEPRIAVGLVASLGERTAVGDVCK